MIFCRHRSLHAAVQLMTYTLCMSKATKNKIPLCETVRVSYKFVSYSLSSQVKSSFEALLAMDSTVGAMQTLLTCIFLPYGELGYQ